MSKIVKASDELIDLFNSVRKKTTIPVWVQFELLSNNKQKTLYKILKTNNVVEVITNGINFAIIFNELIFNELPHDMKVIAIDECLAGIYVNNYDNIYLEKPNFNTYISILQKYGHDSIIRLHESIKSLYDVKKQNDDNDGV